MTVSTEDFLSHYGVKGMKWGVHNTKEEYKSSRENVRSIRKAKSTTAEITEARRRNDARARRIKDNDDIVASTTASAAQKKKALENIKKIAWEHDISDDRIIATKMTNAELWMDVLFSGGTERQAVAVINSITDRDIARKR